MLKLAMVTGMRRGEIFKLEDQDADFTQSLIKIRDPGGKPATIPLSNISGETIEVQKTWRDKVFPGGPYNEKGK